MEDYIGSIIIIGVILIAIAIILGVIVLAPYFEARTFNKFSEEKATYWDAVFGDLRIEANKK